MKRDENLRNFNFSIFMENSIFADMKEIWNKVKNYENYEVSNLGGARSLDHWRDNGAGGYIQKGRILKLDKCKNGYSQVTLCKDGKPKRFLLHRLVWEVFNGTIPDGMQVNHINEDKTDNRLENLNLMSPKENVNWGTGHQRGAEKQKTTHNCKPILQYTLDGVFIKEWPSLMEIRRTTGYHPTCITNCCKGIQNKSYNYIWKFKNVAPTL